MKKLIGVLILISIVLGDVIHFKHGWNFVGFDSNIIFSKDKDLSDVTKVKMIWKYVNDPKVPFNGWNFYSNDDSLVKKAEDLGIYFTDNLAVSEGAWIYALKDFDYNVPPKNHNLKNNTLKANYGWNLLSFVDNSKIDMNLPIFKNNDVFVYRDGNWYIKSNRILPINSYLQLNKINKYEAFWVHKIDIIDNKNLDFKSASIIGKIELDSYKLNKVLYGYIANLRNLKLVSDDLSSFDKSKEINLSKLQKYQLITSSIDVEVNLKGEFNISNIPSGKYSLIYIDNEKKVGKKIDNIIVNPGDKKVVNISNLEKFGSVTLTVENQVSNVPLKNALVKIAELETSKYSDEKGKVTINNIPAGLYSLRVSKDGYVAKVLTFKVNANKTTNLGEILLNSQKGVVIGKIVPELEDVVVYAKASDGSLYSTLTDKNGHYKLILPVGDGYSILVNAHGYATEKLNNVKVSFDSANVLNDIHLNPLASTKVGSISGYARYADINNSLKHAGIIVALEGTDFEAITARDGSYVLNNIPAGNYTINFIESNHVTQTKKVQVIAGANNRLRDVYLIAKKGNVKGKVVDEKGKPVAGAFVTIQTPSGTYTTITDINGEFNINGVISGIHQLNVTKNKYKGTSVIVKVEDSKTTNLSISITSPTIKKIEGYAEFIGPFISGSLVTIKELNNNFVPNGITYSTTVLDNNGHFVLNTSLSTKYMQISVTGNYHNPITGEITKNPITLTGIYKTDETPLYVNALTTLQSYRLGYLLQGGIDYNTAYEMSKKDVEKIFNLTFDNAFSKLSILKDNEDDAKLLASSLELAGKKDNIAIQTLFSNIYIDIQDDGILSNTIKDKIKQNEKELSQKIYSFEFCGNEDNLVDGNCSQVKKIDYNNLKLVDIVSKYQEKFNSFANNFYKYFDSDADGVPNYKDVFIDPIADTFTDVQALKPLYIQAHAYDLNNSKISYTIKYNPSNLADISIKNNGTIKVVAKKVGDVNVTVLASNGLATSSTTFKIKINPDHAVKMKEIVSYQLPQKESVNVYNENENKLISILNNIYYCKYDEYAYSNSCGNEGESIYARIFPYYMYYLDNQSDDYYEYENNYYNFEESGNGNFLYEDDGSFIQDPMNPGYYGYYDEYNNNDRPAYYILQAVDKNFNYIIKFKYNLNCYNYLNDKTGEYGKKTYCDYYDYETGETLETPKCEYDDSNLKLKKAWESQCKVYQQDDGNYSSSGSFTFGFTTLFTSNKNYNISINTEGYDEEDVNYYGDNQNVMISLNKKIYKLGSKYLIANSSQYSSYIELVPDNKKSYISGKIRGVEILSNAIEVFSFSSYSNKSYLYVTKFDKNLNNKKSYKFDLSGNSYVGYYLTSNAIYVAYYKKNDGTYIAKLDFDNKKLTNAVKVSSNNIKTILFDKKFYVIDKDKLTIYDDKVKKIKSNTLDTEVNEVKLYNNILIGKTKDGFVAYNLEPFYKISYIKEEVSYPYYYGENNLDTWFIDKKKNYLIYFSPSEINSYKVLKIIVRKIK